MRVATQLAQSDLSLDPGTYIYRIHRWYAGGELWLICSCSDSTLRLVDANSLTQCAQGTVTTSPSDPSDAAARGNITCSAVIRPSGVVVGTSEGRVHLWGLGSEAAPPVLETAGRAPVASLAVSPDRSRLAVGTELHNHQAAVAVYDAKALIPALDTAQQGQQQQQQQQLVQPLVTFADAHNDDVTALVWSEHGASRYLMSGGTDAVLNVYDTAVAVEEGKDPDEALVRSLNPGSSVAHAGFLTTGDPAREGVFAVSHDEHMTTWAVPVNEGAERPRYEDGEDEQLDDRPKVYGDLRPALDCEYVVDVVEYAGQGGAKILGVGKHSEQRVDLIPLAYGMDLKESLEQSIRLPGAHGGEIVRSFYIDEDSDLIYTCGEDGFIRKWKVEDNPDMVERGKTGSSRGKGRGGSRSSIFGRYKPY